MCDCDLLERECVDKAGTEWWQVHFAWVAQAASVVIYVCCDSSTVTAVAAADDDGDADCQ